MNKATFIFEHSPILQTADDRPQTTALQKLKAFFLFKGHTVALGGPWSIVRGLFVIIRDNSVSEFVIIRVHSCLNFAANLKDMYSISFRFEQKNLEPVTIENLEPDQSILEVALKNDIDLHHNCGGVCACSTCHIYLENGEDLVEEISDKEEDFIDRARNPKLNSRLSCQCVLLRKPGQGKLEVFVPDQSVILGEE